MSYRLSKTLFVDILGKKKVEEMKLQGSIKEIEEAKHQHLVKELLVKEHFMTACDLKCSKRKHPLKQILLSDALYANLHNERYLTMKKFSFRT